MSLTVKQVELLFSNGYVSLPQYKISEKSTTKITQPAPGRRRENRTGTKAPPDRYHAI